MPDELIDTIDYRGYKIEIYPDDDAPNPLADDEGAPMLVLHKSAERHFGWSTDKAWVDRLENALEQIYQRGVTKTLHGPRGALALVARWLKVAYGMKVVLPVSALEHSGVMVYLGDAEHWSDPGGWDSGWIGLLLITAEQAADWQPTDPDTLHLTAVDFFAEFAAWVSGDVLLYRVVDPDDMVVSENSLVYGRDSFNEPDGWALAECKAIIDDEIALRASQPH
jgi:hypothetical protein